VSANIYKDDSAQSVADRVFRHANIKPTSQTKDKRKFLAHVIEEQVNAYILGLKDNVDKETKEMRKLAKQTEQLEREKRLQEAAMKSISQMNTARRLNEKHDKVAKVVCKLSVIVGANKKGDIVVREGDEPRQLVKNFMASYGLKKEMFSTILQSLEALMRSSQKDLSFSAEEQEIDIGHENSFTMSFSQNKTPSPHR